MLLSPAEKGKWVVHMSLLFRRMKKVRLAQLNRTVQHFFCARCGNSFSESQPLDGLRIEHDKVVQICRLLFTNKMMSISKCTVPIFSW